MSILKPTKVLSVESIDDDYEKFVLRINDLNVEMLVSRKGQPKFFYFLMDSLRDDKTFNLNEVDISK